MYQILELSDRIIKFKYNNAIIDINLKDYLDYRKVSCRHYINKNNNIILLPEYFNKLVFIDTPNDRQFDNNKDVYIRSNQFQFDFWNFLEYPDSDNSKIYKKITCS